MAVKIRFTRVGKKHAPVYRIVAVDSRKKRDGEYLENLGTYNPLTKEIVQWHEERIQHWVSVGAIVTDSVKRLQKIKSKQAATVVVEGAVAPKVAKVAKKAAPAKVTPAKDAAVKAAPKAKAVKAAK